jgi:hypothetical protein
MENRRRGEVGEVRRGRGRERVEGGTCQANPN